MKTLRGAATRARCGGWGPLRSAMLIGFGSAPRGLESFGWRPAATLSSFEETTFFLSGLFDEVAVDMTRMRIWILMIRRRRRWWMLAAVRRWRMRVASVACGNLEDGMLALTHLSTPGGLNGRMLSCLASRSGLRWESGCMMAK